MKKLENLIEIFNVNTEDFLSITLKCRLVYTYALYMYEKKEIDFKEM